MVRGLLNHVPSDRRRFASPNHKGQEDGNHGLQGNNGCDGHKNTERHAQGNIVGMALQLAHADQHLTESFPGARKDRGFFFVASALCIHGSGNRLCGQGYEFSGAIGEHE
jgi:hypothetical protein